MRGSHYYSYSSPIPNEATEGLAPLIHQEIWHRLLQLTQSGQTILLIDKDIDESTNFADRHFIVEKRQEVWQVDSAAFSSVAELKAPYLAI